MAIKDFLRKIFSSEQEKKENEKLRIENLEAWLKEKSGEIEKKEKEVAGLIKSNLANLVSELESKILVLERLNLNEKKAEDRIKFIVKENLFLHIKYLKKLVESLKGINEADIEKINTIFSDFTKKASPSYEKATFLIGKELGSVKESISNFFKKSKEIIDENKEFFDKKNIVEKINKEHNNIKNTESSEKQIINHLSEIELSLKDRANAIKSLESEIEHAKKTEKYLANLKRKEENEKAKEDIKKQAIKLRESINFKNLAGIFHTNEKKMKQVKEYNENFLSALENDRGAGLISLLEEIKNHEASEKLRELIRKQEELNNFKHENETRDLESSISKIKAEVESLENEKLRLQKAGEKQSEMKKSIVSEIRHELEKMNIILSE